MEEAREIKDQREADKQEHKNSAPASPPPPLIIPSSTSSSSPPLSPTGVRALPSPSSQAAQELDVCIGTTAGLYWTAHQSTITLEPLSIDSVFTLVDAGPKRKYLQTSCGLFVSLEAAGAGDGPTSQQTCQFKFIAEKRPSTLWRIVHGDYQHFRHLESGLYLCVADEGRALAAGRERSEQGKFRICSAVLQSQLMKKSRVSKDPSDMSTMWSSRFFSLSLPTLSYWRTREEAANKKPVQTIHKDDIRWLAVDANRPDRFNLYLRKSGEAIGLLASDGRTCSAWRRAFEKAGVKIINKKFSPPSKPIAAPVDGEAMQRLSLGQNATVALVVQAAGSPNSSPDPALYCYSPTPSTLSSVVSASGSPSQSPSQSPEPAPLSSPSSSSLRSPRASLRPLLTVHSHLTAITEVATPAPEPSPAAASSRRALSMMNGFEHEELDDDFPADSEGPPSVSLAAQSSIYVSINHRSEFLLSSSMKKSPIAVQLGALANAASWQLLDVPSDCLAPAAGVAALNGRSLVAKYVRDTQGFFLCSDQAGSLYLTQSIKTRSATQNPSAESIWHLTAGSTQCFINIYGRYLSVRPLSCSSPQPSNDSVFRISAAIIQGELKRKSLPKKALIQLAYKKWKTRYFWLGPDALLFWKSESRMIAGEQEQRVNYQDISKIAVIAHKPGRFTLVLCQPSEALGDALELQANNEFERDYWLTGFAGKGVVVTSLGVGLWLSADSSPSGSPAIEPAQAVASPSSKALNR